jgi:hypothetical protein
MNIPAQAELGRGTLGFSSETLMSFAYLVAIWGTGMAFSSLPRNALGKSMALNSAPTRITSEMRYIHTSRAMAAPNEP